MKSEGVERVKYFATSVVEDRGINPGVFLEIRLNAMRWEQGNKTYLWVERILTGVYDLPGEELKDVKKEWYNKKSGNTNLLQAPQTLDLCRDYDITHANDETISDLVDRLHSRESLTKLLRDKDVVWDKATKRLYYQQEHGSVSAELQTR